MSHEPCSFLNNVVIGINIGGVSWSVRTQQDLPAPVPCCSATLSPEPWTLKPLALLGCRRGMQAMLGNFTLPFAVDSDVTLPLYQVGGGPAWLATWCFVWPWFGDVFCDGVSPGGLVGVNKLLTLT